MRIFFGILLLVISPAFAIPQGQNLSRGSIPEILMRPGRGESARYPIDIIIGELGRGDASAAAYFYANSVAAGLLSGRMDHPVLSSINSAVRETFLSELRAINPNNFRIGGGREEADGSVSFLVRFIGREFGITGEMYIRYITRQINVNDYNEETIIGSWVFEALLLDEAKDREMENRQARHRNDFFPYERFF
jgi:hypothetical protein